jgi:hypothetical protein
MGHDEKRILTRLVVIDRDRFPVKIARERIGDIADHDLHGVAPLDVLLDRVEHLAKARFVGVTHGVMVSRDSDPDVGQECPTYVCPARFTTIAL